MTEPSPETPTTTDVRPRSGRVVLAILGLVLFLAVLLAYYYGHKPITGSGAVSLASTLGDLALMLLIVTVAGGIGRQLSSAVPVSPAVAVVVQAALGLGILAFLVLGLLWAGVYSPPVAWVAILVLGLVTARACRRWLLSWTAFRDLAPRSPPEGLAGAAILLLLLPGFVEATAPPVHFDSLVYHLDLPRRFIETGSLFGPLDNLYWGMPMTGEMVYTLAAALGRAQTAALVGFAAAALTVAGVFALAKEVGRPAGWVAVLALLAGPSIAAAAGWGYVDWWAGLFGFATIAIALTLKETTPARWAALAGVMAGLAAGTKYTAAIALPAGFVAVLAALPTRRGLRLAVILAAGGALVFLPWLLKNVAGTGSPLYPYVGSSDVLDPVRQAAVVASNAPPPLAQSLLAPVAATLLGHEQAPGFSSDIGPLMIALLPGLILLPRPELRRVVPVIAFVVTGWILWAAASRLSGLLIQTRLYFVLLPAWAILAGCGFLGYARISLGSVRLGRIVGVLLALVIALGLYRSVRSGVEANALAPILGGESREDYLARRLGGAYAAQSGLARLPAGSRVLMLWEPRGYYCAIACLPDAWIDEWFVERQLEGSPEAIRAVWISRGFSHLLLFDSGRDYVEATDARYSAADWRALDQLLADLAPIGEVGDGYTLYRLE